MRPIDYVCLNPFDIRASRSSAPKQDIRYYLKVLIPSISGQVVRVLVANFSVPTGTWQGGCSLLGK